MGASPRTPYKRENASLGREGQFVSEMLPRHDIFCYQLSFKWAFVNFTDLHVPMHIDDLCVHLHGISRISRRRYFLHSLKKPDILEQWSFGFMNFMKFMKIHEIHVLKFMRLQEVRFGNGDCFDHQSG